MYPAILLVEIVGRKLAAAESNRGRVEGVLWDGDHDRVRFLANQDVQAHVDPLAGAVGEKDLVGVSGNPVAFGDEGSHVLANGLDALALRVSPRAAETRSKDEKRLRFMLRSCGKYSVVGQGGQEHERVRSEGVDSGGDKNNVAGCEGRDKVENVQRERSGSFTQGPFSDRPWPFSLHPRGKLGEGSQVKIVV